MRDSKTESKQADSSNGKPCAAEPPDQLLRNAEPVEDERNEAERDHHEAGLHHAAEPARLEFRGRRARPASQDADKARKADESDRDFCDGLEKIGVLQFLPPPDPRCRPTSTRRTFGVPILHRAEGKGKESPERRGLA